MQMLSLLGKRIAAEEYRQAMAVEIHDLWEAMGPQWYYKYLEQRGPSAAPPEIMEEFCEIGQSCVPPEMEESCEAGQLRIEMQE